MYQAQAVIHLIQDGEQMPGATENSMEAGGPGTSPQKAMLNLCKANKTSRMANAYRIYAATRGHRVLDQARQAEFGISAETLLVLATIGLVSREAGQEYYSMTAEGLTLVEAAILKPGIEAHPALCKLTEAWAEDSSLIDVKPADE